MKKKLGVMLLFMVSFNLLFSLTAFADTSHLSSQITKETTALVNTTSLTSKTSKQIKMKQSKPFEFTSTTPLDVVTSVF